KLQEFIGNDRNSTNLDSRFRGNAEGLGFLFLNFNASRIYRKKQKPFRRHSHESGNLETQSCKNLSEMTETQRTWIPVFAGMPRVWDFCF
ncbi:hypothetical protein M5Z41_11215, partial [Neisseria meningitidis]|nr:hypothetical protein [Neisseria meningitidis]